MLQNNGDDGVRKTGFFDRPDPCKFAYLPLKTTLTIKEFDIIKLSAQFYSVYERNFLFELKKTSVVEEPLFQPYFKFLDSKDERHCFFARLSLGYGRVLLHSRKLLRNEATSRATLMDGFFNLVRQILDQEDDDSKGVETLAMADFPAFEFFVKMEYYYDDLPPQSGNHSQPLQEPFSFPLLPQGIMITRNELDVIKLTAQFVAVFGLDLQQDLIDSVLLMNNPDEIGATLFQFTETTDNRYVFYSQLALGYARVLLCAQKPRKKDVIVERFSSLVCRALKRALDEDVVEMAMLDLHTFEFFVEMEFGDWPVPSPGYLVVVKPPPLIQPPPASQFAGHTRGTSSMGMMQPEERLLKRPKFDKPECSR